MAGMVIRMGTTMPTTAIMDDPLPEGRALLRLMAALSPAFPVGSFSFSHGLERAVQDGLVSDPRSLQAWLRDLIEKGSGWNDAVLFAAAWNSGEAEELGVVAELGSALAGSRERLAETTLQGGAFAAASQVWDSQGPSAGAEAPYAVAVGAFARRQDVPLRPALAAFLQAFASNLIQAALRLAPIGQSAGLRVLAGLETAILKTASRAAESTLEELGSACMMSEISAMRHETQYSRIFRS